MKTRVQSPGLQQQTVSSGSDFLCYFDLMFSLRSFFSYVKCATWGTWQAKCHRSQGGRMREDRFGQTASLIPWLDSVGPSVLCPIKWVLCPLDVFAADVIMKNILSVLAAA